MIKQDQAGDILSRKKRVRDDISGWCRWDLELQLKMRWLLTSMKFPCKLSVTVNPLISASLRVNASMIEPTA